MDIYEQALALHQKHKGKITTALRDIPDSKEKLSQYYTPGVGGVAQYCADNPELTRTVTWTNNLVAVISDGSAVLGLGDIGPYGAMPVMEGKAMLFKHFAGVDAVPIVLNVHETDEIVAAIEAMAPSFGAINLEDIAAPKCFEVEARLKASLPIPVMHDDQHGTAIVVLAGLINAAKITNRTLSDCRIVMIGSGAAGFASAQLVYEYAQPTIIAVDSKGIIHSGRSDLNEQKKVLASYNTPQIKGTLADALKGADVVIGLSKAGMLTGELIKSMAKDPIIFAMANPEPEIKPDEARAAGAAVVATGRSDFPNQINNSLAFPGVFRGALDHGVTKITQQHKLAAAEALAALVPNPTPLQIIPSAFDPNVVKAVAAVIK